MIWVLLTLLPVAYLAGIASGKWLRDRELEHVNTVLHLHARLAMLHHTVRFAHYEEPPRDVPVESSQTRKESLR